MAVNNFNLTTFALTLINSDRRKSNLQSLSLSSIPSAQIHADNMLKEHYFSHWNTMGHKPYMRYTLAGGLGAVAENIAWQWASELKDVSEVMEAIRALQWQMMHDDAKSNWGHRDNILNPEHNRVSIGIAFDQNNVFFVEDFEQDYLKWGKLEIVNRNVTMRGKIEKENLNIQSIGIFYDKPGALTTKQLWNPPYDGLYDHGTCVGMVLPPDWFAEAATTITAKKWIQNSGDFKFEFSMIQPISVFGEGVYTLHLNTGENTKNVLTTYSVWVK